VQHPGAIDMGPVLEVAPAGAERGMTAETRVTVTMPATRRIVVDSFAPPAGAVPTWGGRVPSWTIDTAPAPRPRYSLAGFATLVGVR